jgi:pSer/pThr/pTyr-binding forkhead associated (FHA) protein
MLAFNFDSNEKKVMSRQLKIGLVKPEVNEELGYVQGARTLVGREPDEGGIAIPIQGVSRNHGMFARLRTHWFYKDMQSTNGSWVNGKQVAANEWKLVRPGDIIQLADAAIKISSDSDAGSSHNKISGFPALGGVTLIVFSKGEFIDEFPVPDFGRALVIGGSQGDLQIEGTLEETPNLIIERRSMNVCAYGISKSIKVFHNDTDLTGNVNLSDRDEIKVGHFYIIFNNPELGNKVGSIADRSEMGGQSSVWKEWSNADNKPDLGGSGTEDTEPRTQSKGMFGRAVDEHGVDETIAIPSDQVDEQIAGFDRHPSMRFIMEEEEPVPRNLGNLDEKIIFFIGIILLLGLIGLMMYWLLG